MDSSNKRGYTKAVDIWALGCVAAVLLVGYTPFDNPYNSESVSKDLKALKADLMVLDIGPRPKEFLHNSLVVDETRRMSVKQALGHKWFTDSNVKPTFEEVYERAIRDWKPRLCDEPVIVDLATFSGGHDSAWKPGVDMRGASLDHPSKSTYSNFRVGDTSLLISPARLMEHRYRLNPYSNHHVHMKINTALGNAKREEPDQTELLSEYALQVSPCGTASIQKRAQERTKMPKRINFAPRCSSLQGTPGDMEKNPSYLIPLPEASCIPSKLVMKEPALKKKIAKEADDNDGEVYEEVCNPFTGKRKRRIYGTDVDALL